MQLSLSLVVVLASEYPRRAVVHLKETLVLVFGAH